MTRVMTALVLVVSGLTVSGCCEIQKQPGRCAACCYDGCIIPAVGTGTAALPTAIPVDGSRSKSSPRAMAY
jgi:hypothetical protein